MEGDAQEGNYGAIAVTNVCLTILANPTIDTDKFILSYDWLIPMPLILLCICIKHAPAVSERWMDNVTQDVGVLEMS